MLYGFVRFLKQIQSEKISFVLSVSASASNWTQTYVFV